MLHKRKKIDIVSYVGIIVSILTGFIGLYGQSKDPKTSFSLFLALIGAIFLFFLLSWPINYLKRKINIIDKNSENIETIKKDLNIINDKLKFKEDVAKLDTRVSVVENFLKMEKKGQIDPRWIIIIIILILFYLYLKSKGFF